jgi:hypothetical protein
MKIQMLSIVIATFALASAQDNVVSGVRGKGVVSTAPEQTATVAVRLANVVRENVTKLHGELEFAQEVRGARTRYVISVSPLRDRPVNGVLKVDGKVALLEARGVLSVFRNGRPERFEGTVRARFADNGEVGDRLAVTFTANARTLSFEGNFVRGGITVSSRSAATP